VGSQALNAVLDANTLADSMSKLGTPTKNSFTVADVEAACNKLSNDVAQANDFKNILGAVVGIAKVFI
jgi:hypothetical protein